MCVGLRYRKKEALTLCLILMVKLQWKPQDTSNANMMGCLTRIEAWMELSWIRKRLCMVQVAEPERRQHTSTVAQINTSRSPKARHETTAFCPTGVGII